MCFCCCNKKVIHLVRLLPEFRGYPNIQFLIHTQEGLPASEGTGNGGSLERELPPRPRLRLREDHSLWDSRLSGLTWCSFPRTAPSLVCKKSSCSSVMGRKPFPLCRSGGHGSGRQGWGWLHRWMTLASGALFCTGGLIGKGRV